MTFHVCLFVLSVCLLLSLARLGRLGWLPLHPSHSAVASRRSPVPRLRHRHAPRLTALPVVSAPLLRRVEGQCPQMSRPWPEVKSHRGAPKRRDTAGFACPNPQCPYVGITDAHLHALVGDGKHGRAEPIQTFGCQACHGTCSARGTTPLDRLKTPSHQVAVVLSALAEGLDPCAAERVCGFRQATITRWRTRAGRHAHTLHERFFCHLHLPHLQLDELRTRLRCATQVLWRLAGQRSSHEDSACA
jgi:transposase-like protein